MLSDKLLILVDGNFVYQGQTNNIPIYGEQITYYVGSQFPYLCINFGLLLFYSNQSLQSKLILITYLTLAFIMFFYYYASDWDAEFLVN